MDLLADVADSFHGLVSSLALVIELAHYTQVICGIRNEWDVNKARRQPFATWFMCIACCFGGGVLLNLSIGRPALAPLANTQSVAMMTIVWWHIFYSPKDCVFSFFSWKPALLVVTLFKEMIRTNKIIKGVKLSNATYPDSLLLCTTLGMLGACGGGFVKNTAIMLRSQWNHQSVKNFSFATVTKFCLLFSLLYNLQIRELLPITFNTVMLLQFSTLFLYNAAAKFGITFEPFQTLEGAIMSLTVDYSAFGGEENSKEKVSDEKTNSKKPKGQKKND